MWPDGPCEVVRVLVWAMQAGIVEANPVVGTAKPGCPPRERVLSDAELSRIWKACGDDDYGRCIRLLILTGRTAAGNRRHVLERI